MALKLHASGADRRRHARLTALYDRVRQQITDADCLLKALDEYCRKNPDDCACVASDPNWRAQIARKYEDLAALLLAIREKLE
jgi:hypothetical protein